MKKEFVYKQNIEHDLFLEYQIGNLRKQIKRFKAMKFPLTNGNYQTESIWDLQIFLAFIHRDTGKSTEI
jgi:hypothetical protein